MLCKLKYDGTGEECGFSKKQIAFLEKHIDWSKLGVRIITEHITSGGKATENPVKEDKPPAKEEQSATEGEGENPKEEDPKSEGGQPADEGAKPEEGEAAPSEGEGSSPAS